jgi:DUF4097 and DUF4098 domain-containing protein YvlB
MPSTRICPLLCGLLLVGAAAHAATVKDRFDQTVPLRPGSEVRLTNVNGGVTFEAWDRPEVRIEAEKRVKAGSDEAARKLMSQIRIEVANTPAGLRIDTSLPGREEAGGILAQLFNGSGDVNMDVSYKIHVPRHVALDVESSNGAITVTGTEGNAQLKTSNGRINVAGLAGSLQAETSNGAIDVELTDLASGDLSLESSNGGIAVRLPRDARFSIDAATSNGSIRSDFPVEGGQAGKRSRLKGEVNGGGSRLYIRTSNGSVNIRSL